MRWLLEKIESTVANSVPVMFFVALATGTIFFFLHDVRFDSFMSILGAVAAITMALGLVGFSYAQQVRFRHSYRDVSRQERGTPEYEKADRQFRTSLYILLAVVVVDMTNAFAFWVTLKHPASGFEWFDVVFRVVVFPVLYVLSGFMAKARLDAAEILGKSADKNTLQAVKAWGRQVSVRVKRAVKSEIDLTPIVTTLLEDEGDALSARRVRTITNGLVQTERPGTMGKSAKLYLPPAQAQSGATRNNFPNRNSGANSPSDSTEESGMKLRKTLSFRKPRSVVKRTKRDRVFRILDDDYNMSISAIAAKTGMDRKTVTKYYTEWMDAHSIQLEAGG